MTIRITQQHAINTARGHLQRQAAELFDVQQQISSGQKMQRPSDDPVAMRRALIQKDRLDRLTAHTNSLGHVKSRLDQAHVQLREAGNLLLRARDIALSANGITDESERSILAHELDGILEQLVSVANSQDESGYLFSGTSTLVRPFEVTATGNAVYRGSVENTKLHLTGDVDRKALLPGGDVFQPQARENPVVIGSTHVRAGSGISTATGTKTIDITHSSTTFAPGSGVAAGTSSATSDTIIGAAGVHRIQITDTSGTGAFGTISLNGGAPVDFSSTDTDLRIIDTQGQVVHVDTTSITPGFSGEVDITADGEVSVDGGASSTPLTFAANQSVTDSRDGSTVFLDTALVDRVGSDTIEFPGTSDVFAAITQLRDDIRNTRGLSDSQLSEAINRRVGDLQRVHDHVLDMVGVQSVSLEQLDRLQIRTEDLTLNEQLEYNETTAADITAAVVRMQELTNLQQYTVAAVSKILQPTLLNYLQ
ncbi:MAG: flagellar hook-associated protein FlgL [Planctomycetaceae bacterium]|nr:flagellar hook-associated protein FlgL [Planctomycetaceae bacterium]